jgi:hypothetical protein
MKYPWLPTFLVIACISTGIAFGLRRVKSLPADTQSQLMLQFVTQLTGTLSGASLAFWFAYVKESAKSADDHLFDFQREFSTGETYQARNKADLLCKQFPHKTIGELYAEGKDTTPYFLVVRFYERLGYAVDHKRVRLSAVPDFFGEIFYWWYIVSFETQLQPTGWESWRRIVKLKEWMDGHAPAASRAEWIKRANSERLMRSGAQVVATGGN